MKNYWSDYWAQGYLTSFGQDIKSNYTGKLKSCWLNFSEKLNSNDKVLDIGTGNGALIQLIQESSSVKFNFVGVDKAVVKEKVVGIESSIILSNVSAEHLPFETEEFDAIVTQFAIEYSELVRSIPELFRVLKQGGLYQVVCHEIDSDIVKPNILILESAIRVQSELLAPLKQLINALKKEDNDLINNNISIVNKCVELEKKIHPLAIRGTRYTDFYHFILKNRKIDLEKAYYLFSQELEGLIYRLSDLKQAALSAQYLKQILASEGSVYKETLIDSNKEYIGTLYRGYKL